MARSVGDGGSAAVLRDRFGGVDGVERDCEVRVLRVVRGAGSSLGSLSVHEARRRSVRRVNEKEPADGAGGATAMAMNEIRQQARKSAAERVARLRQQRADLVKKQEELSATVMTALAERDAVIADAERRAGAALKELASSGLSLARGSPVVRPRR